MMQEHEIELMKRYIYQVVRRVPKGQRDEIALELEELIGDMYDDGKGTMEEILAELGDPKEVAKKHLNFKGYLIGPEYFDNYIWILKIVLLCAGITAFLSQVIGYDYSDFRIVEYIIEVCVETVVGMIGAFGVVTIVFAVLEYLQVKVDLRTEKKWSVDQLQEETVKEDTNSTRQSMNSTAWNPTKLTPVPNKKALISRGETVVGVVFIMILCSLFVFVPEKIGAFVFEGKEYVRSIPIFNLDKWSILCPIMLAGFLVSFFDEIVRLITGCYCKLVLFSCIITNCIQLVLMTILFKCMPIWNPTFSAEVTEAYGKKFNAKGDLMTYWETSRVSNIVLAIIWVISLGEIGFTVYKTLRYSNESFVK